MKGDAALTRNTVRSLYDAQKIRIEMGNRMSAHLKDHVLTDHWAERIKERESAMRKIERGLLRDVEKLLQDFPIYWWLYEVRGCGPAMSGCIIAEIGATPTKPNSFPQPGPNCPSCIGTCDCTGKELIFQWDPRHGIARFDTVSKLWAYSGLHVIDGHAPRRTRGERANWNNFLKTKLLGVLGPCFLKSGSSYRKFYDNYKTRKQNTMIPVCMNCEGNKQIISPETKKLVKCRNCSGTGGPAPWGKSDGHRHNAAIRYMIKMFIMELYNEWRKLEGLEIRRPYAEEYLGKTHVG